MNKRVAGFTLIELLVTFAVAGILFAVAAPAFRTFLQSDKMLTESNTLAISFNMARSEAIKLDTTVSVCPSADGATCTGTAEWAKGWIVLPATGAPISVTGALPSGTTLTEKNSQTAVTYNSSGVAATLPLAAQFTLCDNRGAQYARYVEVSPYSGRVASSNTVGQSLSGTALTCP